MKRKDLSLSQTSKFNRIYEILYNRLDKSTYWLSEQTGIANATLYKYLVGDAEPTLDKLYLIAEKMEVDASELLRPRKKLPKGASKTS